MHCANVAVFANPLCMSKLWRPSALNNMPLRRANAQIYHSPGRRTVKKSASSDCERVGGRRDPACVYWQ